VEENLSGNAIPKEFICPISKMILFEPVKAKDGIVYEKELIVQCIKDGKNSPVSNQRLYSADLEDDITTQVMVEEYLERCPQHKAEVYLPDHNRKALLEDIRTKNIAGIKAMLKKDVRFYLYPLERGRNIFQLICEMPAFSAKDQAVLDELLSFLHTEKMLKPVTEAKRPNDWNPVRLNEKLMVYVKNGDHENIEKMLFFGANIQTKSTTNKSLIHIAAENKHIETVKLLLRKGLPCPSDENQPRPLIHIAVESKDSQLIDLALQSGASLDVKNNNGVSVLQRAVKDKDKDIDMIKYLLEKGANPNNKDSQGNNALHLALQMKLPEEILLLLIQKGAYYKERNQENKRPIDLINNTKLLYAMERAHKDAKQEKLATLYKRISFLEEKVKNYENKDKETKKAEIISQSPNVNQNKF